MSADGNGGAGDGVTRTGVTVVTIAYDHETCTVSLGVKDAKIGLVQMMIDEAGRQLEYMRRMAQLQEMQQNAVEQARVAALMNSRGGGR